VLQDANFRNGSPVGDLCRRGADGQVRTVATYVGGQQLVNRIVYFPESKKKQLEAMYLVATTIELAPDDFWQLRFAEYRVQPEQLRHGSWKCWYSNGQLHSEGFFQYDRESGTFTWWHAHGQQAVKGTFVDGQPVGTWTWWHANGQKAAEGQYRNGRQVGMWQTWAVDGRLVQRFDTESPAVAGRNVRPPVQLIQQQASTETAR
jgi:antitoxin component YwqK of YwqJK toxin-antitoxin module